MFGSRTSRLQGSEVGGVAIGADLVLASLGLNLLSLVVPFVVLQVYDRVLPNNGDVTLVALVVLVAASLALDAAFRVSRGHLTAWAGARFEHGANMRALSRLVLSPSRDGAAVRSGDHLERFQAIAQVREFISGQSLLLAVDFPFALIMLAVMACISPPLALVAVGLLSLFVAGAALVGVRLRGAVEDRRTIDDRRFSFLIETLGNIHTIKALGMEALLTRRYERLIESSGATSVSVNLLQGIAQGLGAHISQLSMVAVTGVGGVFVVRGDLTVGGLAACSLLAGRSLQPLLRAMGFWAQIQTARAARRRVEDALAPGAVEPAPLPALPPVQGGIELRGVEFRFATADPPVLQDIDLSIAPGEAVAIRGETGSGRSTLLGLLLGLHLPTKGSVLIDGHDTAAFDRASLRGQIAYLPPTGVIFRGTILENLTLFRSGLQDEAMALAAKLGLHEFVARLPQGYATMVGNTAVDALPGGVRQRIAIARGLLSRSRIILFDEADGQLDTEGDRLVKQVLQGYRGKATMILLSHRPSVLAMADRVVTLAQGRLVSSPPATAARAS